MGVDDTEQSDVGSTSTDENTTDNFNEWAEDPVKENLDGTGPGSNDGANPQQGQPSTTSNSPSIGRQSSQEQEPRQTKGPDEIYCQSCGEPIKKEAEICPECGVRQKDPHDSGDAEKNPGLAAVASAVITGAGQIYNGQIMKGIGLIIIQAINVVLMFVIIGFITFFATWVYGIYDAYKTAERINEGEITI